MSNYVDGFVIPVPKANIDAYRKMAELAGQVWKDHGALAYWECAGEDLGGEHTSRFPEIAEAGPDDTVFFSWIVYESREHRDEVNAKVMEDPRLKDMMDPEEMPFDCKKMAYGGFTPLVKY